MAPPATMRMGEHTTRCMHRERSRRRWGQYGRPGVGMETSSKRPSLSKKGYGAGFASQAERFGGGVLQQVAVEEVLELKKKVTEEGADTPEMVWNFDE